MDGPRIEPEEQHHSELTAARGEATGPEIATDPATTKPHG
jgi:hypothetical protein